MGRMYYTIQLHSKANRDTHTLFRRDPTNTDNPMDPYTNKNYCVARLYKNWHLKHLRLITESQPTISEILSNVTSPFNNCNGNCCCAEVHQRLKQRGMKANLPITEGHIFGISRDYQGPNAECITNWSQ